MKAIIRRARRLQCPHHGPWCGGRACCCRDQHAVRPPDKIAIDRRYLWTGVCIDPDQRRTYVILVPAVALRWDWRP